MEENKMGVMEIKRLMVTMSLPIMISMLVQALYNIIDSMFVARISQNALAAVSLSYPVQMIIVAVACGTAVGMNALLSRYLGQRKTEKANQVALHGIFLALCNWFLFAIIGFFFSESFLRLFSSNEEILQMGINYMRICTIFSFGIFIQITYERIMQATGNTVYNMMLQGAGALINIILDPIFIFGWFGIPALGVSGAALATILGQTIAMIIGIALTKYKIKEVQLHFKQFKFRIQMMKELYRIAIPAILMQSIMSFMTVFMNMILTPFSEIAVSVFSIYFKLQQFVFMVVFGLNNALIPVISYNYGARNKQRILTAIHFSLFISCIIMLCGTIVFQLIPTALLQLFNAQDEMFTIGIPALKIISISFLFAGVSFVLCSVYQALGHGNTSLIITLFRQILLLLPIAYVLAKQFGLHALWWAFPITEILLSIASLWYLKRIQNRTLQDI